MAAGQADGATASLPQAPGTVAGEDAPRGQQDQSAALEPEDSGAATGGLHLQEPTEGNDDSAEQQER